MNKIEYKDLTVFSTERKNLLDIIKSLTNLKKTEIIDFVFPSN